MLLILAVLWAIVLVPPKLRTRAESRKLRSIRRFRRRLAVLAPPVEPVPAHRPEGASRPFGAARPHVAVIADAHRPLRLPLTPAAEAAPEAPAARTGRELSPAASRRRLMFARRRRLAGLLLAMAVTLLLGAQPLVPGLRPLLTVHLGLNLACAAYVVWLRRARRLDAEKARKVRYLPPADAHTGEVAMAAVAVGARAGDTGPLRRSATSS